VTVEKDLMKSPTRNLSGDNFSWALSGDHVTVTGVFSNLSSSNDYWNLSNNDGIDRGSEWTAFKSTYEGSTIPIRVQCRLTAQHYTGYDGPILAGHRDMFFGPEDFSELIDFSSTEQSLLAFGTTAISRVLPTNPISDLPTAVGELLGEGLPGYIGSAIKRGGKVSAAAVAGEYLNYEFGIKPFLADLQAFHTATVRAKALIDQYTRDAGRKIRRRYAPPAETVTEIIDHGDDGGYGLWLGGPLPSMQGFLTPVLDGYSGTRVDVNKTLKKRWFSGAFTYFLPGNNSWSQKLLRDEAEMRHLYGGISANTAWNLLPWSWAADWFSNAGDVIHNINAFAQDGLVMPYGYVMERCELSSYRTVQGARFGRMVEPDIIDIPTVSSTYGAVFQRRRKATPFGFGLTEESFTTRQYAIATALGVTRAIR